MKNFFTALVVFFTVSTAHSQIVSEGFPYRDEHNELGMRTTFKSSDWNSLEKKLEQFTYENNILIIYSKKDLENKDFFTILRQGGYIGYLLFDLLPGTNEFIVCWPATPKEYEGKSFYDLTVKEKWVSLITTSTMTSVSLFEN